MLQLGSSAERPTGCFKLRHKNEFAERENETECRKMTRVVRSERAGTSTWSWRQRDIYRQFSFRNGNPALQFRGQGK
jgi:hypothetical protein